MNKKSIAPIIIVIIVLIALFLVAVVIATVTDGYVVIPGGKNKVICDVRIHDPIIGEPMIENYLCEIKGTCLLTIQPLGIVTNVGYAELTMGGKSVKKKYETFKLTGDDEVTLKMCTDATTGTLRLTNEEGTTIDTKKVDVG